MRKTALDVAPLLALVFTACMIVTSATRPAPVFASVGREYPAPAKTVVTATAERKNSLELLLGGPEERLQLELKCLKLQARVDKIRAEEERKRRPKPVAAVPKGFPKPEDLEPFLAAEKAYRVPWQITYAIYALESRCGKDLGTYQPDQVMPAEQWNAFQKICRRIGLDPYRQLVSKSGDVGPMQFQPATWQAYGTDADGDGLANPWSLSDAAASTARYLKQHGYHMSPATSVAAYNGGKMQDPERAARATAYSRKVVRLAQSLGLRTGRKS